MKIDLLILAGLPIAFLLQDLLIFKMGPVFITTYKLILALGGIYYAKYFNPNFLKNNNYITNVLRVYIIFLFIIIYSIVSSSFISLTEKINHTLFNMATISIANGLSFKLYKSEYYIKHFSRIIFSVFLIEFLVSSMQVITKSQVVPSVGNIIGNMPYHIFGLNYERLALNEFLAVGIALLFSKNFSRLNNFFKFTLSSISTIIVYLTGSFTGLLGILGTFIIVRTRLKIFLGVMIVIILAYGSNILLRQGILSDSSIEIREFRYHSYFSDYQYSNWRYISSVEIVKGFIDNPSLLGEGFRASKYYLSSIYESHIYSKFAILLKEDKLVSSHMFIGILYDQGLIGFIFGATLLLLMGQGGYRVIKNHEYDYFSALTFILVFTSILRYLVYYHSLQHWHMVLSIVLLNTYIKTRIK